MGRKQYRGTAYELQSRKLLAASNSSKHLMPIVECIDSLENERVDWIFPWPSGTVSMFWMNLNPNPKHSERLVKWILEQCEGLADVASFLLSQPDYTVNELNIRTCHKFGSITADSIFWFPDIDTRAAEGSGGVTGKLVIAGSEFSKLPMLPEILRYWAPEKYHPRCEFSMRQMFGRWGAFSSRV